MHNEEWTERQLKVSWRWLSENRQVAEFCFSLSRKHPVPVDEVISALGEYSTPFYTDSLYNAALQWERVPSMAGMVEFVATYRKG